MDISGSSGEQPRQQYGNISQPHIMPMPTTSWNLETMPWKLATTSIEQDSVMQFRANGLDRALQRRALHQKRKSNLYDPSVPTLPVKQFISEEKITAHFNGLHISSDHIQTQDPNSPMPGTSGTVSGKCFTNLTYHDYQVTAKELEEKLRNANRITMCEEVRKMHEEQKRVSFLPEALLNRIEKPCTALVLWQPPPLLDLLKNKSDAEIKTMTSAENKLEDYVDVSDSIDNGNNNIGVDDEEFSDAEPDIEIDDFIDNNNTCRVDLNNLNNTRSVDMDEDL